MGGTEREHVRPICKGSGRWRALKWFVKNVVTAATKHSTDLHFPSCHWAVRSMTCTSRPFQQQEMSLSIYVYRQTLNRVVVKAKNFQCISSVCIDQSRESQWLLPKCECCLFILDCQFAPKVRGDQLKKNITPDLNHLLPAAWLAYRHRPYKRLKL